MIQFKSQKYYKISILGMKRPREVEKVQINQLEQGIISFTDLDGKQHIIMGKDLEVYIEEI